MPDSGLRHVSSTAPVEPEVRDASISLVSPKSTTKNPKQFIDTQTPIRVQNWAVSRPVASAAAAVSPDRGHRQADGQRRDDAHQKDQEEPAAGAEKGATHPHPQDQDHSDWNRQGIGRVPRTDHRSRVAARPGRWSVLCTAQAHCTGAFGPNERARVRCSGLNLKSPPSVRHTSQVALWRGRAFVRPRLGGSGSA